MKGKEVKCRQALMRLRGLDDVDEEMKELEEEAKEQRQSEKVGIWDVLMIRNPDWKKPLIISVCVHAGQQLTGINAIFLVDKFGRRNLLLYSVAVVTVSSTVLAFSISFQYRFDWLKWISLGMVYLFLVAFHFGAASIPFVIVPELWSQSPRAAAMSISAQANWYSNFLVGLLFPYQKDIMNGYTFLIFAMCSFLYALMTAVYVPETKGRTFEQITASFKSGSNPNSTSKSGSDDPAGIINPVYQPEDTESTHGAMNRSTTDTYL